MNRRAFLLAVMLFPPLGSKVAAQTVSLNFDELTASSNYFTGSQIPTNARLDDGYLTTYGVRFSSSGGYVGVAQLGSGHAVSGLNGITGSTASNTFSYAAANPITASFFNPAAPATPFVTDFVSLRGDLMGNGGTLTLNAYNTAGVLIASNSADDAGGTLLSVSAIGIQKIEFIGNSSTAVDDFTFHAVTPVSEPSAILLAGSVAALISEYIRRRTKCCGRPAGHISVLDPQPQ